jgi:2',3'-cyclic-nucleotide 2'-phosphodiesterase (5'-nucleotidase family)
MLSSCGGKQLAVTKISGTDMGVTAAKGENAAIENFIKPYREHIDKELSTVLAYAPQTLDKSGEWQSKIGNLFADASLQKGNPVFKARTGSNIDICLLNHGGIRSIIAMGNVTTRTAFEIMPFENNLVVVTLSGDQVLEMAQYIINEKKPHPLSGMTFTIDKSKQPTKILIGGQLFDNSKTYNVATSDYLYNGGDNMIFFKKGTAVYDLDCKLRNVLIDYFTDVDTIPIITDQRITVEK